MTYSVCAAMVFFTTFAFIAPAAAANCKLFLLTSVDMSPTSSGVMTVPVVINGVERRLLLDTGGISSLSQSLATGLKLKLTKNDHIGVSDVGGRISHDFVWLDSVQLGRLSGKHVSFAIWPDPHFGYDGLIGPDVLSNYDVELNFAAGKLDIFSPDHCEGKVVYWPASKIAVVPFSSNRGLSDDPDNPEAFEFGSAIPDNHIRVPVTLDGTPFTAIIDTGASNTTMSASVAKYAFGIAADSKGTVPIENVNGDPREKSFSYAFRSLALDGVTVSSPRIIILPDLMRTGQTKDRKDIYDRGGRMDRPAEHMAFELVIGMDVLKQLHLYIAYHEKKLYITPAELPTGPLVRTP